MPVYIYGLKCPIAGVIRYVGKSLYPEIRHRAHIESAAASRYKHHTSRWIRKLLAVGMGPELVILHCVAEGEHWQDIERSFIASATERGWRLTNTTAGGEGLDYLDPAETAKYRANLSAAMKDLWNSQDRREEQKRRSLKAWADPVLREKRLAVNKAACTTPQFIEKMRRINTEIASRHEVNSKKSASMKATLSDPVRKARHDAALSSDETRAKMAKSAEKKWADPARKAKLLAYMGTPEYRKKHAEGIARRATPAYRAMMAEKTRLSWRKRNS